MRISRPSIQAFARRCALGASVAAMVAAGATRAQEPPAAPPAARASPADYRLSTWPPRARTPDFALTDVDGRPRTLTDYRGRVLVVFFGFVHCPDACPAELFKLALALKQLGPLRERIQVLFITLDPERDTPALLKSYLAAFDPEFTALTGTADQIDRSAANFYVEYARVGTGSEYSIDHSTSTFLIDAGGRLRLVGTIKASAGDFAHDLRALATETPRAVR